MSDSNSISIPDIERIIRSKLTEHSNNKLLNIKTGVTIYSFLLLHPSPQVLIKKIVDERCVEDLILLFLVMGVATNAVLRERPMINKNDLLERADAINQMIRQESLIFDNFAKSLSDFQKNLGKTKLLVDDFVAAYEKKNFDVSDYISSHRDLLSLGVDAYLLSLVITAQKKASDEELNNLINAVQELRLALVNYRAKEHF